MTPERQRDAFQAAQRKAAGFRTLSAFAGQDLATIGESLYCYVPRLLRHLGFEQLLDDVLGRSGLFLRNRLLGH